MDKMALVDESDNLNDMNHDSTTSDCEFVSENEVLKNTRVKGNKKPTKKAAKRKNETKPPLAPTVSDCDSLSFENKRSQWFAHFQRCNIVDVAECKYCHKHIGCSSKQGTTPLKNHINSCSQYQPNSCSQYQPSIDKRQKLIDLESKTRVSDDGSIENISIPKLWEFSQENIRKALSRMLIIDELPFSFVEHEGFIEFCKVINPHFLVPSRSTATRDCYSLFIGERKKLSDVFQKLSSRVCLTTDTWTSLQNMSYMCLTAHFIDDDWRLHKRIINFCPVAGHSGLLIGSAVEKCLTEWGLKNILTVTVDNSSSNDVALQHLKKVFNHWECGLLKGDFLHMRCAAHILNLVVKDGLNDVSISVKKVRDLVKYVRSSPARLQKFKACVEEEKIESKSLVTMDVETRWNSTFLMLESALKFRKAFSNLLLKDSNCEKELRKCAGGLITDDDWLNVSSLLPFLKIFFDATLRFSGSRYVTANAYMHEIFGIGNVIDAFILHDEPSVKNMAMKMLSKYIKYWGKLAKLNQFLFIALFLDPRRKWQYIQWIVEDKYDLKTASEFLESLWDNIVALFQVYASSFPQKNMDQEVSSRSSTSTSSMLEHGVPINIDKLMTDKFELAMGNSNNTVKKKTELDKYKAEDREFNDPDFDVLKWWKVQQIRYPVLAKMARDMLAIPVSTVASESAFSTRGRVLDSFRTSLTPRMVEALVCTQDWIRASHNRISIEDTFAEIENMEEECLKDLTLEQPTITIDETLDGQETEVLDTDLSDQDN